MLALEIVIVVLLSVLLLDKLGVPIFRLLFFTFCLAIGSIWAVFHPRVFKQRLKKRIAEKTAEEILERAELKGDEKA